jgi:dihydrolipoamide dehydrogenase
VEPGVVEAGDTRLEAPHLVVATGSEPIIPEVEGLAQAGYWTNREAALVKRIPESLIALGGGPVALELGQVLARFGCRVTILERGERVLGREDAPVGAELQKRLEEDGVEILTGTSAVRVIRTGSGRRVELEDGRVLEAAEVLVATGRRPRTGNLGLETYGLDSPRALDVDERGRVMGEGAALQGLWGVGDVTGKALFTHVAKYQGRTVAANIDGEERVLDYGAVPRVIFTDPPVAAVGRGEEGSAGPDGPLRAFQVELREVTRSWTFEREPRGFLRLVVDGSGTVRGVQIVGPLAGEWIHLGALAVKLGLPARDLEEWIVQYPTFSETYIAAAEAAAADRRSKAGG